MYRELIFKIKAKKPLDRLDGNFVEYFIVNFFKRNYKLKKNFLDGNFKKRDFEFIVKNVRNELNKVYGQFWINDFEHVSSKERVDDTEYIYKKIFETTGKPKVVLDLGAGLNPVNYRFFNDVFFIAAELTDHDCENIKRIYKKYNIKGSVIKLNFYDYKLLPKSDVCFMFKLLDIIETKGHKLAEKLVKDADARYLVVSFSTADIKGRRMKYPRRMWFEVMIKRLGFDFTKFETRNEVFYIVKK